MQYDEFIAMLKKVLLKGAVFPNPGGGTSTIVSFGNDIHYLRGKSTIRVAPKIFFEAYVKFKGSRITSHDLKGFNPKVFDINYNGHPCNCTFFFQTLMALGLIDSIHGKGVRGNPFFVNI